MDTTASHRPSDTIENCLRGDQQRSRLVSLAISGCLVALVLAALAWIGLKVVPNPEPPVIGVAPGKHANLERDPLTFPHPHFPRRKPAPPSAAPSHTIAAAFSSPIAIPSSASPSEAPDSGPSWGAGFDIGTTGQFGPGGAQGIPGGFHQRCSSADRAQRLVKAGGKPAMDKTVLRALRWLKEEQHADGHWGDKFPVAMTAFALLCYSGHCETVDSPEFGDSVTRAIAYLVGIAETNKGMLASTMDRNTSYEHAIAVYSLAEAYSMNKNARKPFKRISPILKKAVPIIIEGQTNGGGWLYAYANNGVGDLSVAGWNIQALKAAEHTGLKFSGLATAKKKALLYLAAAESPNGDEGVFKYRIRAGEIGRLPLTGVGLLCSRMLGKPSKLEKRGLELILEKPPKSWSKPNLYAWYYHSQAAFQKGGSPWDKFNRSYQQVVHEAQLKDGSWNYPGGHAASTGSDAQIYATCLSTLMMEVYYRYLPTGEKT